MLAARVELKNWGAKDGAGIFSTLSSNRPNEYPFIIPNETLSGQFTPMKMARHSSEPAHG